MKRARTLTALAGAMIFSVLWLLTVPASGWPPYLNAWEQTYPESTLPQRMNQIWGTNGACYVCHQPEGLGVEGTCYRIDIRNVLKDGFGILDAIEIVGTMDSSGDGFTNAEKITMVREDDPDHVGYHPGLIGALGTSPCGPDPDAPITGMPETPGVTLTPGDLNGDGTVGVPDLLILIGNWGSCPSVGPCVADLTGDGSVGVSDLLVMISNWG